VSLLRIEGVTKWYKRGRLERVAVRNLSLAVDAGELVAVWGVRGSGRSTLLRLAAGIELPDEGRVSFDGRDLAKSRNRVLGKGIGYCRASMPKDGGLALEHVAAGLLAQKVLPRQARHRAEDMLRRVGAEHCGQLECYELDGVECVRVAIAAALIVGPKLLVIDEPTNGVDLLERDPILALLRSIANEGVAVLISASDAQGLAGVDRALSIDSGELRGDIRPTDARVVPLRAMPAPVDPADSQPVRGH
jgi:ABC-type multidrug transport system ATPase subunit